MPIPVVDIFAGPGGLGEGFASFETPDSCQRPFRIAVSAEMDANAVRTLRLRSFFRQFAPGHAPASYYDYVAGRAEKPWTASTEAEWSRASKEALRLTLGNREDDAQLHERIGKIVPRNRPWLLVGGPPCQAYSLVGRARNRGTSGYRAEEDARHFLYRHYLKILTDFRPAVFVMENVKGVLSSRVGGERMFPRILEDLEAPGGKAGPKYTIVPLLAEERGRDASERGSQFLLRAEELGVPQARHRVVLLGVSNSIIPRRLGAVLPLSERFTVRDVIGGLPRLRSGVTDQNFPAWHSFASDVLSQAAFVSGDDGVSEVLRRAAGRLPKRDPGQGGRWAPKTAGSEKVPDHLRAWLLDSRLDGVLNHEVRAHMMPDLVRYAFAAAFADVHGKSPRGAREFPPLLGPEHKNWTSGKFVDRFKVQTWKRPSSTITSHLRKDGHYFIHPDASQLRSFSVREAARLQTFPDNYFFEGGRGAQFQQVGNAVPPWMARQIAAVVHSCLAS